MMVVFDLDGTLVDSTSTLLAAHRATWNHAGLPCPPDHEILELTGLPLLHIMETLAPDEDPHALAEVYSRAYVAVAPETERPFDGVEELLRKPYRAAVATGKSQRGADRVVQQFGWQDRFDIVLGGNAVARPKPYPDMLDAIRKQTGATDLIMVGDTTYDLEMAHAAGIPAIGVSWGHHTPEQLRQWAPVVDSVAELADKLGI